MGSVFGFFFFFSMVLFFCLMKLKFIVFFGSFFSVLSVGKDLVGVLILLGISEFMKRRSFMVVWSVGRVLF